MRTKRALAYAALVVAAWLVPAGAAMAGKPGGGGTVPPGTIYFRGGDGNSVCSMDGGGANRTVLGGLTKGPAGTYRPSRLLHGGARWFLHLEPVPSESGPGGDPRDDFFAVRQDGAVRVRLTSDPAIKYQYRCEWGADESETGVTVAVVGARWTGTSYTDTVIPGSCGLYVAHLAFDGVGNVVGLDAEPSLVAALPTRGAVGRESADTWSFLSWSPDMTRIAYNPQIWTGNNLPIRVANLVSGTVTDIGLGNDPDWSPDGSRIVCRRFVEGSKPNQKDATAIETVSPDGSGRTTVASRPVFVSPTLSQYVSTPKWSPDGGSIAYQLLFDDHYTNGTVCVYRVARDGSGNTNLTPGSEGSSLLLRDWRP